MPPEQVVLCRLKDIVDGGSKGMSVALAAGSRDIFVVRQGGRIYGYLNQCPHTGGPLDWVADQFLDLEREYIQCATHAALFRIIDGRCIAGPCTGNALTPISLSIEAGNVVWQLVHCATGMRDPSPC